MCSVRELNKSDSEKPEYLEVNEIKTVLDEVSLICLSKISLKLFKLLDKVLLQERLVFSFQSETSYVRSHVLCQVSLPYRRLGFDALKLLQNPSDCDYKCTCNAHLQKEGVSSDSTPDERNLE